MDNLKIKIWTLKPNEQKPYKIFVIRLFLFLIISLSFFSWQLSEISSNFEDLSAETLSVSDKECFIESNKKLIVLFPLDCTLSNLKDNRRYQFITLGLVNVVIKYQIIDSISGEVIMQDNFNVFREYEKFNTLVPVSHNQYTIQIKAFSNFEQNNLVDSLEF